jgi:hypothetical protein
MDLDGRDRFRGCDRTRKNSVFDQAVDAVQRIAEANFFTLGEGAAIIGDAYLIDPHPRNSGDLHVQFCIEGKSLFLQSYIPDGGSFYYFITCVCVGQVHIGKQVADESQQFVAEGMPEE